MLVSEELIVATGKVVDGKVEVEGDPLEEGRRVRVFIFDDSPVSLTEEERRFLRNALADVERAEVAAAFEFLEWPRSSRSPGN